MNIYMLLTYIPQHCHCSHSIMMKCTSKVPSESAQWSYVFLRPMLFPGSKKIVKLIGKYFFIDVLVKWNYCFMGPNTKMIYLYCKIGAGWWRVGFQKEDHRSLLVNFIQKVEAFRGNAPSSVPCTQHMSQCFWTKKRNNIKQVLSLK